MIVWQRVEQCKETRQGLPLGKSKLLRLTWKVEKRGFENETAPIQINYLNRSCFDKRQ